MKILTIGPEVNIDIIPRIYPSATSSLIVKLRNEMTNEKIEMDNTYINDRGYIKITLDNNVEFIKENSRYEIIVETDNSVIYRGIGIGELSGKDIQNFTEATILPNKIIKF